MTAHEPPDDQTVAKPRVVVVVGPTAVGKTNLGVALGKRFNGEVISADSRYLYRGFDIGVAKPDIVERGGIPHHLIDVIPPDGDISLATYQDLALAAINQTVARGRLPLLVGGTPLYVNAVIEGWRIPRVPPNPLVRAELEAEAAAFGLARLTERLRAVDPVIAARSGTNERRVIRALEVYAATGTPMSALEGKGPPPFKTLEIGLSMPRDRLYQMIDARVDANIARGLITEVRGLLEGGIAPDAPAMSSIGYRQLLPYLSGDSTIDDAVHRIKADTHRYVRHQETWLRRNPRLIRLDVTEPDWIDTASALVADFLGESDSTHGSAS